MPGHVFADGNVLRPSVHVQVVALSAPYEAQVFHIGGVVTGKRLGWENAYTGGGDTAQGVEIIACNGGGISDFELAIPQRTNCAGL